MNRPAWVIAALITITTAWSMPGTAQEQEQEPPSFAAIEAYMCNWNDRKGMGDLMKVVDKWNAWTDENSPAPYTAWLLTPVLTSVNMPADVVWLGAWQNGIDLGRGMQAWMDGGAALQADYDKVLDCFEHSNSASMNIREPKHEWPGDGGVAVFSNCTVAEGKTIPDAMAAHAAWAAHLDSIGSQAGMWVFFPGAGNDNPQWHYKLVSSHLDFNSYGHDFEAFTNGQSWAEASKIFAGVVDCDSPRVYHSSVVRNGGVSPN